MHAQLERISSAKLDEMLSFQKSLSDKIGLGYVPSTYSQFIPKHVCHNVLFIPTHDNDQTENIAPICDINLEDKNVKGRSILGAPPQGTPLKKEVKKDNHCSSNQKFQPKRAHLCQHYGMTRHTHPNCYKWLAR